MDRVIPQKTHLLSLFCLALGAAPLATAECASGVPVEVKGKIVNNLQASGPFSTLGVVHLKLKDIGRMKCGIVGVPAESVIPPEVGGMGFTHTISCDDNLEVELPAATLLAHSQLTLDTQGHIFNPAYCNGLDASNGVSGSFIETSHPQSVMGYSTGRGLFTGVTEGDITIEGTINCLGTIDMDFRGELCLVAL